MDVEMLSRIQFGFTITFHYIYPPLSIGLSLALIFMKWIYLKTQDVAWEKITKFWLKVFSMTFALGVATGIPLPFSFGTNWSRYSEFVGDVFGSALGMEGFFAFLIEAGFLGVLLFGWNRVTPRVHFLSTIFVSFGAHFSAVWIITANSWMQTPAGYRLTTLADGSTVAQVTNWLEMFLNHTNLSHITHVILGAWLAGAFLIVSVSAYYMLKKRHLDFAKKSMKIGLVISSICIVLQLISADNLTRKVARFNPEQFAALEGVYETKPHTPAYVFGWVDTENQIVHGLSIPGMLSWMTYSDASTPIRGLDQFSEDQWPRVNLVFQLYHLMILSWLAMLITAALGLYYWYKNRWTMKPWVFRLMTLSVLFPQIGNLAGWYTAEFGRQPYTVYKLLKTSEAFTPIISRGQVIASLTMFVFLYLLFFVLFLVLLDQKIKSGPEEEQEQLPYRNIYKA